MILSKKYVSILSIAIAMAVYGCATGSRQAPDAEGSGAARDLASATSGSEFQRALSRLKLKVFSANLHSHHYMVSRGGSAPEAGPCKVGGRFMYDDGRPCRNDSSGQNSVVPVADPVDYFRQACTYAAKEGKLDILFVTPHSKSGADGDDTSTTLEGFQDRHRILKEINDDINRRSPGKFYCGLGQEASSIASGNHMNIMGQFPIAEGNRTNPYFFPSGKFDQVFPQFRERAAAGERLVVQLNHPDVRDDLWWKPVSQLPKKKRKEALNDYGLDDYAPVGCLLKGGEVQGCRGDLPDTISAELLKETFARIREESGNPFRLIEIVSPKGATENPTTEFRSVRDTAEVHQGLYDYVFYLSMGFRLSPTANQDNHHMNYGSATASRTGVLAASLEESEVLRALQSRRTFASEDLDAKVLLFAESGGTAQIAGDEITASGKTQEITVGYEDPSPAERNARVQIYYYAENDALDFRYSADQRNVLKTFGSPRPIRSGEVIRIQLPVKSGVQYAFAEVTQDSDKERIWSAPIWIRGR